MTQQNTQAVVLKQPNGEKLQLELKITQVADDTTAMKSFEKGADISIASFDYATGIAVFLALCATGLAYWFGVRSFVLTKQSFDSLIEQIKSSENVTLMTNQQLIKSQELQKETEIKFHKKMRKSEKLLEKGGELLVAQDELLIEFYKILSSTDVDFDMKILKLNQINQLILSKYTLFMLLMEKGSISHLRIKYLGNLFLQLGWELIFKTRTLSQFNNFVLDEDFIKEHSKNNELSNNSLIFNGDEVKAIQKAFQNGEIYSVLLDISSLCQDEIHDYLFKVEAA